jgi:cytochrome c-type biogenesis protein CcmE
MANVDDELRAALEDSERTAQAEPAPVAVPLPPADRPRPKRHKGLLIGLLVMAAAILTLVFTSLEGSVVYSRTVAEVVKDKDKLAGRNLRVEGTLKRCSLARRDDPCEYRFVVQDGAAEIPVRYARCTVPDTFKDVAGMTTQVTAEGTMTDSGHFEASTIMAKCPSKYEMKERAMKGEDAPHMAAAENQPCM